GGFFLTSDKVPSEEAVLLAAAARVVLGGDRGSLTDQIDRVVPTQLTLPSQLPPSAVAVKFIGSPVQPPEGLSFWNGLGGFTHDGREYAIVIDGSSHIAPLLPPSPWTNVLANPQFGCLVTEAGLGYSWAGNSQMNRLTPWSNDPTSDQPSEIVYLRDEETGEFWTPTPLPSGAGATLIVRHGQGYTRYSHVSHDLKQELLVFVPTDDPIKLVRLSVRNDSDRQRRLTATYYAEWVLGTLRENAPLNVVCECERESSAILARNAWAGPFAEKIAFAACDSAVHSFTADRLEFLGDHGSISMPAAMRQVGLSGRDGAALDPCAAIMTELTLAPGETKEVVFALGQANTLQDVRQLINKYSESHSIDVALTQVQQQWD